MIQQKQISRLWLLLVMAVIVGCDGYVGVNGRVVDAAAKPLRGSAVSLSRPGDAIRFDSETDAAGCFALGGLVAARKRDYVLTVSLAGYKGFRGTYRSGRDHVVLVRLAVDGSQGESSASANESLAELHRCDSAGSVGLDAQAANQLPLFANYPVPEVFTGTPAPVDFDSHPDANRYRAALAADSAAQAQEDRFAGHYRIVVIGCGTTCQSVWAIDLVDGRIHSLFTASYGVAYRPDSRLIVENDPAYYEGLLQRVPLAEVERQMQTYGGPRFWVERSGEFEQIGPEDVRIDPQTKKLVAAPVERESP